MENPNYWNGRNVFVSGGTGVIGKNLVSSLLQKGANVIVMTRRDVNRYNFFREDIGKCEIVIGDITRKGDVKRLERILREREITDLFHLAAQSIPGKSLSKGGAKETEMVNTGGTKNILDACERVGKLSSIIVASSINAYGYPKNGDLPFKEEDLTPASGIPEGSVYDISKAEGDLYAQKIAKEQGLPVGIIRCSNIFGEGDLYFEKHLVPKLIKCIREDREFPVKGGSQKRGFFYVKDAVSGFLMLAEKIGKNKQFIGEAFNFGPNKPIVLDDFIHLVIKYSSNPCYDKLRIESIETKDMGDLYHDSSKAKKLLHWKPQYSLGRGLREMFKWYDSYLSSC